MAYMLELFNGVYLPIGNPSTDMAPVAARAAIVQTMAGAYDLDEDEDATADLPHSISYEGLSMGEDDTYASWQAVENAFRAQVGKRGQLWRRAEGDGTVQWALCRLMALTGTRATADKAWKQDSFQWLQLSQWRGHDHRDWQLDDGYYLESGLYLDDAVTFVYDHDPYTKVITHDGNVRVTDAVIEITAGGTTITGVRITKDGVSDLNYNNFMTSGQKLVIDCGNYAVTVDGVNAYDDFFLGAGHLINEWLRIEPGSNSLLINLGVASLIDPPTIAIRYVESWK